MFSVLSAPAICKGVPAVEAAWCRGRGRARIAGQKRTRGRDSGKDGKLRAEVEREGKGLEREAALRETGANVHSLCALAMEEGSFAS